MPPPVPVSVVVPCYRCADTIERALVSIACQTRPPVEVLLVEDASDDGGATMRAIEHASDRLREVCSVRVLEQARNQGPAAARNRAWELSTQPYLAFLDSDDAWHPRKLELHAGWMLAHPEVALSGHASRLIRPEALHQQGETPWAESVVEPLSMLWSNPFCTRGVMLKQSLTLRFPEHMRRAEDYSLWLSIVFEGHRSYRLGSVLAFSFKPAFGVGGLTRELWPMEQGELAAYDMLRAAGRISSATTMAAKAWSLARFVRRVAISRLRER